MFFFCVFMKKKKTQFSFEQDIITSANYELHGHKGWAYPTKFVSHLSLLGFFYSS